MIIKYLTPWPIAETKQKPTKSIFYCICSSLSLCIYSKYDNLPRNRTSHGLFAHHVPHVVKNTSKKSSVLAPRRSK